MLAQFPSAVLTLMSQQSSSWGTRGTQGALWICPYREEVVQRFSDMDGCLGQGQNPRLPSEPRLQFKRRQIADVKPEMNSTIDRFIIDRYDGLWMIFKESHPFSFILSCLWGWFLPQHWCWPPSPTICYTIPNPTQVSEGSAWGSFPPTAGKPDTTAGWWWD